VENFDILYKAFRYEIEHRGICNTVLFRDGDDETEVEWFTCVYEPTSKDGLGFELAVISTGFYQLDIGLFNIGVDMNVVNRSELEWAIQLADLVQMLLNGQLSIVLTERVSDNAWQAGELIWTDEKGNTRVVSVVSNHERSRDVLSARLIRNNETYPLIHLPPEHTAHPPKINGTYLYSRSIDLKHLEPLTKKEFNYIQTTHPVQLMGGTAGEPMWQLFYRRIEFWLVTLLVLTLYVYVTEMWMNSESLMNAILRSITGLIGLVIVVFVSSILLMRRQKILDEDKAPFAEKIERVLFSRYGPVLLVTLSIGTMYFAPIWSPHEDIHHLYTALQLPGLLLPVTLVSALYTIALFAIRRTSRLKKVFRAVLFSIGVGASFYLNTVICYAGEDAALAEWWWVLLVAGLPAAISLGLIIDIFIPVRSRTKLLMKKK
jgi:hypothetical protein